MPGFLKTPPTPEQMVVDTIKGQATQAVVPEAVQRAAAAARAQIEASQRAVQPAGVPVQPTGVPVQQPATQQPPKSLFQQVAPQPPTPEAIPVQVPVQEPRMPDGVQSVNDVLQPKQPDANDELRADVQKLIDQMSELNQKRQKKEEALKPYSPPEDMDDDTASAFKAMNEQMQALYKKVGEMTTQAPKEGDADETMKNEMMKKMNTMTFDALVSSKVPEWEKLSTDARFINYIMQNGDPMDTSGKKYSELLTEARSAGNITAAGEIVKRFKDAHNVQDQPVASPPSGGSQGMDAVPVQEIPEQMRQYKQDDIKRYLDGVLARVRAGVSMKTEEDRQGFRNAMRQINNAQLQGRVTS